MVGLPLGDPSMRTPASIMYNILGEDDVMDVSSLLYLFELSCPYQFNLFLIFMFQGEAGFRLAHRLIARALSVPGASVHWYDKPG